MLSIYLSKKQRWQTSLNDKQIFFHILRSEIKNVSITTEIKSTLTEKDLDKIYELLKAHDLTHLFSNIIKMGY